MPGARRLQKVTDTFARPMKNEIKRMAFLNLTVFCFIFLNCAAAKANEPLIYVKANLNERYDSEIISKYGEIWIGYVVSDNNIPPGEYETFLIEKAYYYYKKNGNYVLLGSIDKTGLYDKNGLCVVPAPAPPLISSDNEIAGINSNFLKHC
ncbi:MAG: hypothetical protein LBH43_16200, partial [Treponema sp.]|nr:hypothetical protein [Treponema sp.]